MKSRHLSDARTDVALAAAAHEGAPSEPKTYQKRAMRLSSATPQLRCAPLSERAHPLRQLSGVWCLCAKQPFQSW
jgi:hypothetical protein